MEEDDTLLIPFNIMRMEYVNAILKYLLQGIRWITYEWVSSMKIKGGT